MQISSRFTIAIHVLACIDTFKDEQKLTSEFLAASVNVNPVIIRRLLRQLKSAGIITVTRGSGGAELAKPTSQITFLDIYNAVECVDDGKLFHFHENPSSACPVGRNIHKALDGRLEQIQHAMESEMAAITLCDAVAEVRSYILKEQNGN